MIYHIVSIIKDLSQPIYYYCKYRKVFCEKSPLKRQTKFLKKLIFIEVADSKKGLLDKYFSRILLKV